MAELLASDLLEDDASEVASEHLARGTRLGRYELLVPIAKGGMARVWAARQHGHRGFTKLVALKTILPHLARDQEFERMFLDEARIASLVQHPNVCTIYELGEEGSVLYLAMEWVHGSSLSHLLRPTPAEKGAPPPKAEPLEPRVVARIVSEACAGLNAAHELTDDDGQALGVVHRDVSPHNILISEGGHVKVADFGVAKALGQMHSATSAGQLKGKLNYMAPEQLTGSEVDRRSDLFSLGCVLYEATTGLQPFRGDGDHQVMHRLLKGEFDPPSTVIKGYPQELEKIVTRAMAPQPLLRFSTAALLRQALEEWLARSGPIVTEAHIAAAVKARVGVALDKRRDRIRAASASPSRVDLGSDPPPADAMTPSGRGRSGVKASGSQMGGLTAPRPISATPPPLPVSAASMPTIATGDVARPSMRSTPPAPDTENAPTLISDGPAVDVLPREPMVSAVLLPPASRTHFAMAIVLGIIAASALAAISFFAWRATSSPSEIVVVAPPLTAAPSPGVASAAPAALERRSADVVFALVPDTAILIVTASRCR